MVKFRSKARPGVSLVEILIVVVMVGLLFTVSFKSFQNARDRSSAAQMDGNAREISQALQVYQADTEKLPNYLAFPVLPAVPDAGKTYLLAPLGTTQYLPGNKLPKPPYSTCWQSNNINKTPADIPAQDPAKGFFRVASINLAASTLKVPPAPAPLGAGKFPPASTSSSPQVFTATTYGAIIYEPNAGQSLYILHGVGKANGDARVVAIATNAR